jgi:transcriptional antiterminator RfaH
MGYWACAQLEAHRERLALHTLDLAGYATYLPRVRIQRSAVAGRRATERSTWLFPGYAFVWIELQWHAARWSPGVARLVSAGGAKPAKVPVSVIEDLQSRERNGFVVLQPPRLTRGDRVQVIHGPLKGSIAIYQGMRGRQRVGVLLTFLGAQQRIVLNRNDVRVVETGRPHVVQAPKLGSNHVIRPKKFGFRDEIEIFGGG